MRWSNREDVAYVEPNYELRLSKIPDDTYIDFQREHYLEQINAFEGWDIVTENRKITIADVDTGVDLTHPDLQKNIVAGINVLDFTQPPLDENGHGTKVIGVLAAEGNNNRGIAGILWSANVMPVKVMDNDRGGRVSDLVIGINESVEQGASVILVSLGDYVYRQLLEDAVLHAEKQGVVVVAAGGNDRGSMYGDRARVHYPAAFPTVIGVGAVDEHDQPQAYSNHGPEVDVVAPGVVMTTRMGGEYAQLVSGTSFAAPQVAGLAALILSQHPDLPPAAIRNHIRYTA